MASKVQTAACKLAHRLLIAKSKNLPNFETQFPDLQKIVSELETRLSQINTNWRTTKYVLTELQSQTCRKMANIWIMRARSRNQKPISNYFYRL